MSSAIIYEVKYTKNKTDLLQVSVIVMIFKIDNKLPIEIRRQ